MGQKELAQFLQATVGQPVASAYYSAREAEDTLTEALISLQRILELSSERLGSLNEDELRELSARASVFLGQAESLALQAEALHNLAQAAALRGTAPRGKHVRDGS